MTTYNAFWQLIWPDRILHNLLMSVILVTVPRPLGRKTGGEETYEDPELEEQEHAQIPQHISTAMQRLGKTEVESVGRK